MTSLATALFRLRWSLIHRGGRETLRHALHPQPAPSHPNTIHPFDLQHHTDTSGTLEAHTIASPHPNAVYATAYHAIPPSRFLAILDRWRATPPLHPIHDTTFIDLGCGKGRAVLLATQLPFKSVIGVELNPQLAQTAANNLALWQRTRPTAAPAHILHQDATAFQPPSGPCVFYLYNPFAAPLVERLIAHLARSFANRPGELDILYFTPDAASLFESHPSFTTLWTQSIPITPADAAAELPISVVDQCTAYRHQ